MKTIKKTDLLIKALAIAGTVLVWFPLLAPAVLSMTRSIAGRMFRFDYLMPAELFPVALAGGGVLLWAALRARSRRGIIGGGLGVAAVSLVVSQALAVVTGLATGSIAPVGWPWALVLALIVLYSLALVVIGAGGVLLVRDLFNAAGSAENA